MALKLISILLLVQVKFMFSKEVLFAEEFTAQIFDKQDVINWDNDSTYTCPQNNYTGFSNNTFLGIYTKNQTANKTFSGFPPHWSFQCDLIFQCTLDDDNFIRVLFDKVTIKDYYKSDGPGGFYICTSNGQMDYMMYFNHNVTTHNQSSIIFAMITFCNEELYNEGGGLRNFYLYLDTCHFSCLTCNGPNKDNCLTCPPNSTQTLKTCSCNSGYYSYEYTCVASCPTGYVVKKDSYYCIEDPCQRNCNKCDTSNQICTQCNPGYLLYEGNCVTACPPSSTLTGTTCVDASTNLVYPGYLIKNGLSQEKFGESHIKSLGLIITGFQGDRGQYDSSALTSRCGENYYLLGGPLLSSRGSIKAKYTGLATHWSVRIQYNIFKIDNWSHQQDYLKVDNVAISPNYTNISQGSNICGHNQIADTIQKVEANFTHSSPNLTVEITTSLTDTPYRQSFGINNIFILLEYCPTICATCNAQDCISCYPGFFLCNKTCLSSCPSGYFSFNFVCYPCTAPCLTCTGSATTCLSCQTSTYLSSSQCLANCPAHYWPNTQTLYSFKWLDLEN